MYNRANHHEFPSPTHHPPPSSSETFPGMGTTLTDIAQDRQPSIFLDIALIVADLYISYISLALVSQRVKDVFNKQLTVKHKLHD